MALVDNDVVGLTPKLELYFTRCHPNPGKYNSKLFSSAVIVTKNSNSRYSSYNSNINSINTSIKTNIKPVHDEAIFAYRGKILFIPGCVQGAIIQLVCLCVCQSVCSIRRNY